MSNPVRLSKKPEISFEDKIESWLNAHALIIIMICFALLTALFVCLIFALTGVSATESGTVYNHFQDVI